MERIALAIAPGEDELEVASALELVLAQHGFSVAITTTVETAAEIVRRAPGIELVIFTTARGATRPTLEGLKALCAGRLSLRTILLTAVTGATAEALAEAAACVQKGLLDGVLVKPDVVTPLLALVRSWDRTNLPALNSGKRCLS